VLAKEIERSAELFQILDVVWVEKMALLEVLKTFVDVAFDSKDKCLQVKSIFRSLTVFVPV